MANKENVFIDGMSVKSPHEKAPKFVKANISIKVEDFIKFANEHSKKGWLNIDIKKSKGGKLYASLNQYEKGDETGGHVEEITPEDLPF